MDMDKLLSDLQMDEGWRPFLYDDANSQHIVPGVKVVGHPTCAWGFALDVSPLTQSEAMPILESRASHKYDELRIAIPWIDQLPEPSQRALTNMAYNMGVTKLLTFHIFLSLMQQHQFEQAANDLEGTAWFHQVGARATRIQTLIKGHD